MRSSRGRRLCRPRGDWGFGGGWGEMKMRFVASGARMEPPPARGAHGAIHAICAVQSSVSRSASGHGDRRLGASTRSTCWDVCALCGRGASASSRGRRSATARRLAATTAWVRPARRRHRLRLTTPSAGLEPAPTAAGAPSTTIHACWATRAARAGATPTRPTAPATGTMRARTEIEKMDGLGPNIKASISF
jgi:hypothetical protein